MGLPWRHALKTLTLTVCLCVWTQRASAQGAGAEVTNARVGETATLRAPVTGIILTSAWYRGTAVADPQLICSYAGSPLQINGSQYTGRETCGPDGYLKITDLRTNDTGHYFGNVAPSGAAPVSATRQLKVYEKPDVASNNGLSGGAIAGIVIAAVVVLAGVGVLVYIFVFKKPASGAAAAGDSTEMTPNSKPPASPKANGATAEIQYSSVNFVPKRGTPAKPIAPENTVYSEVRR